MSSGFRSLQASAAESRAHTSRSEERSSSDTRRVKLSSVINQSDDPEVDILDDAAIQQAYANYRKRIGALPPADQELSSEQLSSLHSLFASGRAPYCDMAVWGPHHHRLQKKIRLKGVRLSPQGEIIPVEISGPADFESWRESYSVFSTGVELCRGFHKGECKEKDPIGFCIKNNRRRHQCAKCLSEEHGANVCPIESPRPPREFKPKGGKKGGKSGS